MGHKLVGIFTLLVFIIGSLHAQTTGIEYSYELDEHLLTLSKPSAPEVFRGHVIFTTPSTYRRAGIAFAHENWAKIHWFRKLELPIDDVESFVEDRKTPQQFYHDSGIMFTVYTPPPDTAFLEYRLIVDGLWIADPLNSANRFDADSGIKTSLVYVDPQPPAVVNQEPESGPVTFRYVGEPSDTVFLTGSFNNWDPFMYKMEEYMPGRYSLSLNLPAGTYYYAFYLRGERNHDAANPEKIYLLDGRTASVLAVR
jgi:hypothetical protein